MTHQASSSYTWEPSLDRGRYIGGLFLDARISGPSDCRTVGISKVKLSQSGPRLVQAPGVDATKDFNILQHTSTCGLPGHEIVRLMDGRGNLTYATVVHMYSAF